MQNYDFLLPVLETFLEEHGVRYIHERKPEYTLANGENPLLQAASKKTGIPPEALYRDYIKPYEKIYANHFFSSEGVISRSADSVGACLTAIAELQTEWCAHQGAGFMGTTFLKGQYVFSIERVNKSKRYTDSQWLVAWVVDLNLPGFPIKQDSPPITGGVLYWPPYLQCLYCGRIDTDKRGYPFNKKNKFCHVYGCKTGSNPTDHKHGCCYGEWRQMTKVFRTRLNRAVTRGASQWEIEKIFLEFLSDRLKDLHAKDLPSIRRYSDYRSSRIKEGWQRTLANIAEAPLEALVERINLIYSWAEKIHPEDTDFWHDSFVLDAYGAVSPSLDKIEIEIEVIKKLTEAFSHSVCPAEIKGIAPGIEESWIRFHQRESIFSGKTKELFS